MKKLLIFKNWVVEITKKIYHWQGFDKWKNIEGWKYITVNLIGNLFPVWFLLIIEIGNYGFSFDGFHKTVAQPYTYLILCIAFASSTLYLWIKDIKTNNQGDDIPTKKVSVWIIFYIIILFPIIGFYLNKKDCLETYKVGNCNCDCDRIVPVIYWLSFTVLCIYIYFQLKDFEELKKLEEKSKGNPTATVNSQINKLNEDL